ncbi:hypothetical protein LTR09_010764 [Extremus antarcticus]|uniref:Uncharacterized protein n=1 Tax=Extremus antarcticus TaxID=702011 RepID=A0AAJ0DDH6_9PEZI|nr:hypothetical protein LTR09_010764 [Extremus antarcticus]
MAVPTLDDREQQSLDTLLDRLEDAGPHAMNEDLATQITQTIFHSQPEFTDIILKEAMIYVVCRLRKAVDDMLEFASIAVKQHPTKIDAAMWRAQGECYKGITGRAGFEEGMTFDDFERDVRESLAVDAVTLRRGIVDFSALAIVPEIAAGRLAKAICVAQGDIDGLIRESDSIVPCATVDLCRHSAVGLGSHQSSAVASFPPGPNIDDSLEVGNFALPALEHAGATFKAANSLPDYNEATDSSARGDKGSLA